MDAFSATEGYQILQSVTIEANVQYIELRAFKDMRCIVQINLMAEVSFGTC